MIPICNASEAKPRGEITFAFPYWVVNSPRLTNKPRTLNCGQYFPWSILSLAGLALEDPSTMEPYRAVADQYPRDGIGSRQWGRPHLCQARAKHGQEKEEEKRIQRGKRHRLKDRSGCYTQSAKIQVSIYPSSLEDWPLRSRPLTLESLQTVWLSTCTPGISRVSQGNTFPDMWQLCIWFVFCWCSELVLVS